MLKSTGSRVEKCTLGDSQHGSPHVAPWDLWGLAITFNLSKYCPSLGEICFTYCVTEQPLVHQSGRSARGSIKPQIYGNLHGMTER